MCQTLLGGLYTTLEGRRAGFYNRLTQQVLCGPHPFPRVSTQSLCPDTPPSRRSPAPGRSPQSRRVHWGEETWGELGLRGWGLPWTHPHLAGEHRAPFQPQWLTSTPPRCGLHCLLPPPREGALRTPVLAPHSSLPAPLQGCFRV